MLVLLIIWSFLGTCCWSLGTLLLEFCFPNAIADQRDRFWVSLWLGIVILCNLLLGRPFKICLTMLGNERSMMLLFFNFKG
jgi:hypothetical protein